MRIISGIARGMQLDAPRDRDAIRPTTDRVKEAIFSALGNLAGTTVVDLFSGSGALGAEALSRGATTVIAIEKDRKYTNLVKRNLENVAARIQERIDWRVIVGDATRAAHLLPANTPDIVLADAPYFPDGDCPIQTLLNAPPFQIWLGDGVWVVERSRHNPLPLLANSPWQVLREKRYGDTVVHFLKARPQP